MVAMWFPCKNTREMFASSVFTIVLPELQFLLALIAATIWDSILRMKKKRMRFVLMKREESELESWHCCSHVARKEQWTPGIESEPCFEWESSRDFFTLRQCFFREPDRVTWNNNWTELDRFFCLLKFHNWQQVKVVLSAKVDDANIVLINAVMNVVAGCGFDHWVNPLTWIHNTRSRCVCSFIVPLEAVAHIVYIFFSDLPHSEWHLCTS